MIILLQYDRQLSKDFIFYFGVNLHSIHETAGACALFDTDFCNLLWCFLHICHINLSAI